MKVVMIPVFGQMEENSYFYIDENTKEAFLIDPGAEAQLLMDYAKENGLTIRAILLTHGHFDHIGAANKIQETLSVPVYAFEGSEYLSDPAMNLSAMFGEMIMITDYISVSDGTILRLSGRSSRTLRVIYAPGHTTDSVLYYDEAEQLAFVGDTIFKGSYGNYTLPGGDRKTLFTTLRDVVLTLPKETKLYSGHTDMTTVGEERPN